jgi:5-(carboxyamino)imidazole ribonucleotide synthase
VKIGVIGAGQLGRMLGLAGYPLGLTFRFWDLTQDSPAFPLGENMVGAYDDSEALERFASGLDLVTYEFENVPVSTAENLAARLPVWPPPAALAVSQDRLSERTCFAKLGIPNPPYIGVNSKDELEDAVRTIGLPAVLKTRRLGYDGKGQQLLTTAADLAAATVSVPSILEGFVSFSRELSIIAVRSTAGETHFYPLAENHHGDGILRWSIAPAPGLRLELEAMARDYATRVLDAFGYAGAFTIELFETGSGLIANEMAPRVHNSGHWTIEGSPVSQFENHLRAILGWPLGPTERPEPAGLINLLGTLPDLRWVLSQPDVHLHLYGKQSRPGRKLGHLTVTGHPGEDMKSRLAELLASLNST